MCGVNEVTLSTASSNEPCPSCLSLLQYAQATNAREKHMRYLVAATSAAQQHSAPHAAGWGTLGPQVHGWGAGQATAAAAAAAGGIAGSSAQQAWQPGYGGGSWFSVTGSKPNDISSAGVWGVDLDEHMSVSGLQPGQSHTPARVGGQQFPFWMGGGNSSSMKTGLGPRLRKGGGFGTAVRQQRRQQWPPGEPAAAGAAEKQSEASSAASKAVVGSGLEEERVVSIAASKYFSAVATEKGEVWTFGADYNGALGSEASWSTHAQRVTGVLAEKVKELGGAVQVAAGSTFCACLTASGRVLVWGKLAGGVPSAPGLFAASGKMVEEVQGLSGVSTIAAGSQHLLMNDGEKVWGIGRWVDGAGKEVGVATWDRPQELLHVGKEQGGVRKVVAGRQSSAVVTGDGQLYMWGLLLDKQHAERLLGHGGVGSTEEVREMLERVDWGWAGFGGANPQLVEGVFGVRDVALGGWHALVLVD